MKPIRIDSSSPIPIYKQICEQIRAAILCGEVAVGSALPGTRTLGSRLGVNTLTVNKAYQELRHEGLVENRRGSGIFVLELQQSESEDSRAKDLLNRVSEIYRTARSYGLNQSQFERIVKTAIGEVDHAKD